MSTISTGWLDWLWRTSWQAAVLVVLVLVVQRVFQRKLTARWRYALWLLVLVRLSMPVLPESPVSLFNYTGVVSPASSTSTAEVSLPTGVSRFTPRAQPPRTVQADARHETAIPGDVPVASVPREPGMATVVGQSAEVESSNTRMFRGDGMPVLVTLIWALGAGLLAVRIIGKNVAFLTRLRGAREAVETNSLLENCQKLLNMRVSIRVFETDQVKSPALYGLFGYRLLLPAGMTTQFSPRELRHVFLHELAHVRRHDIAVHWLATALQVLHWFNPVIWFAFHRMAVDREMATDELALSSAGEGENRPYGETVIKLLEHLSRPAALPGLMGILEDKHQMTRRISMIAEFHRPGRWPLVALLILPMLALVSLTEARSRIETKAVREVMDERLRPAVSTGPAVKVHVVDAATRAPVEGAEVVAPSIGLWGGEVDCELPNAHWFTDSSGVATIRLGHVAAPGREVNYGISVRHGNYAPRGASWLDRDGDSRTNEVTVHLVRGGTVGGIVVDASGRPCRGVQLRISALGMGSLSEKDGRTSENAEYWTGNSVVAVTDRKGRWHVDHFPSDFTSVYIDAMLPDGSRQLFAYAILDLEEHFLRAHQPLNPEELRAGTARLVLQRGYTVRGVVVDTAGRPLANIRVKETPGFIGYQNVFYTDRNGRFELPNRVSRQLVLTAEPTNFAMTSVVVKVGADTGEVKLQVSPLSPFRISVVDTNGNLLPNAKIVGGKDAVDFVGFTDGSGSLTWSNAPISPLSLNVSSASGELSLFARADSSHRSITLKLRHASDRKVTFSGVVVEAETGRPVTGLQVAYSARDTTSMREDFRRREAFASNQFQVAISEKNDAWSYGVRLRITADGCMPLMTDQRSFDEGDWDAKFEMHAAVKLNGVVRLPDGAPASGRKVLVFDEKSVGLDPEGRLGQLAYQSITTGSEGQFELEHPGDDYSIIVCEEEGFLQTTIEQLKTQPKLTLQKWGRVEVVSRKSYWPGPDGDRILLSSGQIPDNRWFFGWPRDPSSQRLVFEKVPPGEHYLHRSFVGPGGGISRDTYQMPVEVKAGETTKVNFPAMGRPVVGRVAGDFNWANDKHVLVLKEPDVRRPARDEFPTANEYSKKMQEAFQRWNIARRVYPVEIHADREFWIEDVVPGTYELRIRVTRKQERGVNVWNDPMHREILGAVEREVVVPPISGGRSDLPVDIGVIEVPRIGCRVAE